MNPDLRTRGLEPSRYLVLKHDDLTRKLFTSLMSTYAGRFDDLVRENVDLIANMFREAWRQMQQHRRYFVLRYDTQGTNVHDPFAREALTQYASVVQFWNQQFAQDLFDELERTKPSPGNYCQTCGLHVDFETDLGIENKCPHCGKVGYETAPQPSLRGKRDEPMDMSGVDLPVATPVTLADRLRDFINRNSLENGSNTPDYILATLLERLLEAFNGAVRDRDVWYHGKVMQPGSGS